MENPLENPQDNNDESFKFGSTSIKNLLGTAKDHLAAIEKESFRERNENFNIELHKLADEALEKWSLLYDEFVASIKAQEARIQIDTESIQDIFNQHANFINETIKQHVEESKAHWSAHIAIMDNFFSSLEGAKKALSSIGDESALNAFNEFKNVAIDSYFRSREQLVAEIYQLKQELNKLKQEQYRQRAAMVNTQQAIDLDRVKQNEVERLQEQFFTLFRQLSTDMQSVVDKAFEYHISSGN